MADIEPPWTGRGPDAATTSLARVLALVAAPSVVEGSPSIKGLQTAWPPSKRKDVQ